MTAGSVRGNSRCAPAGLRHDLVVAPSSQRSAKPQRGQKRVACDQFASASAVTIRCRVGGS